MNEEIADIWANHKANMISEALYNHYKLFNMSKDFAKRLELFQRLSSTEVSQLY